MRVAKGLENIIPTRCITLSNVIDMFHVVFLPRHRIGALNGAWAF